jgi:hypothetical protein
LRLLSIAAFTAFADRHPDDQGSVAEVVARLMTNEVKRNGDFFAGNEELFEGSGMPILVGFKERCPGFVDENEVVEEMSNT